MKGAHSELQMVAINELAYVEDLWLWNPIHMSCSVRFNLFSRHYRLGSLFCPNCWNPGLTLTTAILITFSQWASAPLCKEVFRLISTRFNASVNFSIFCLKPPYTSFCDPAPFERSVLQFAFFLAAAWIIDRLMCTIVHEAGEVSKEKNLLSSKFNSDVSCTPGVNPNLSLLSLSRCLFVSSSSSAQLRALKLCESRTTYSSQ